MEKVYLVCLIVGFIVPLITLVSSAIDGFFDFVAFDVLNLDIGNFSVDFLPLSINALSLASLLFGGIGLLLENKFSLLVTNIIAGVIAYIGAVMLQSLVGYLKRIKNFADTQQMMYARVGHIQNAIKANGFGSVSLSITNSSIVSFTAKSFDGSEIPQDTEVEVLEIKDNVAIVKVKERLEDKYEK